MQLQRENYYRKHCIQRESDGSNKKNCSKKQSSYRHHQMWPATQDQPSKYDILTWCQHPQENQHKKKLRSFLYEGKNNGEFTFARFEMEKAFEENIQINRHQKYFFQKNYDFTLLERSLTQIVTQEVCNINDD